MESLEQRIQRVESHFTEHWDRLLFRDFLIEHPAVATEYQTLKVDLAARFPRDRIRYAQAKAGFIERVTALAKS